MCYYQAQYYIHAEAAWIMNIYWHLRLIYASSLTPRTHVHPVFASPIWMGFSVITNQQNHIHLYYHLQIILWNIWNHFLRTTLGNTRSTTHVEWIQFKLTHSNLGTKYTPPSISIVAFQNKSYSVSEYPQNI